MHNNFLIDRRGKMSKSAGEFLRLQTLVDKGFHPLAYRLMCLQAHYRSELEFSWEGLLAAFVRLKRTVMGVEKLKKATPPNFEPPKVTNDDMLERLTAFSQSAFEDLNTPVALTHIEYVATMKSLDVGQKLSAIEKMDPVLGLNLLTLTRKDLRIRPANAIITEAEIESALAARKEARAATDFAKSDAIRDDLIAKGVDVMDGDALGWDWRIEI
jgi:cysteinyl-tRNA synthetase